MLDLLTIGLPQYIWIMEGQRLTCWAGRALMPSWSRARDLMPDHHRLIVKIQSGQRDVVGAEIADDVLYVYSTLSYSVTPTAC